MVNQVLFRGGGEGGCMILWPQCEDLSKILLVAKFELKRPDNKLVITFCAIWHYRDLKG